MIDMKFNVKSEQSIVAFYVVLIWPKPTLGIIGLIVITMQDF